MKKIFTLLLLFAAYQLQAQTIISDDFESYTTSDYIGAQTNWRTWANTPMGADDIQVAQTTGFGTMALTNALHFTSTVANGGPTDILFELSGPHNTGTAVIKYLFKNDANKSGYSNFQTTNVSGTFHSNIFFEANGDVRVTDDNNALLLEGSYNPGVWNEIVFEVNLNSNDWELFVGNVSQGHFQANVYDIAMINFYPTSQNSGFWIDEISFTHYPFILPARNGSLAKLDVENGLVSQSRTPSITIRNLGTMPITSFDVNLTANGTPMPTYNSPAINVISGATYTFDLPNSFALIPNLNTVSGTISNVNGTPLDDENTDDTKTVTLTPVTPAADKIVVGEEATGTWCGWCPRGDVALKNMDEKYAGFWQGIAVHNGDPMADATYDAGIGTKISGYPSGLVDRGADIDPGAFETGFLERIVVPPVAKIINGATYDATSGNLSVSLKTAFLSNANGNYKLACVIVEDSVTGTASGYNQANYYAGGNNGVMGGYELLPSTVPASQMVYKHVARAIAPSFAGIANAFPMPATTGNNFVYNFNFNISNYNADKIHIVGLLMSPDGRIENASTTTILEAEQLGFVLNTKENVLQPEQISIYPNPTSDQIQLLIQELDKNTAAVLEVISLDGKVVVSKELNLIAGSNRASVDVKDLAHANYILKISNEGGVLYTTTFTKK